MGWFGGDKPKPPVDPTKPQVPIQDKWFPNLAARRDQRVADAATADAATKLANTTPVAPPPTTLLASTNVDLARAAADRMRKRTGGGLLSGGDTYRAGPKAKLKAQTLIGGV